MLFRVTSTAGLIWKINKCLIIFVLFLFFAQVVRLYEYQHRTFSLSVDFLLAHIFEMRVFFCKSLKYKNNGIYLIDFIICLRYKKIE